MNKMDIIILGAGAPHLGQEHLILSSDGQWLKNDIFSEFQNKLFVLGHAETEIAQRLGNFQKVINRNWQTTSATYSMLLALENIEDEVIVIYSDIVFTDGLFKKIADIRSDIAITIDTDWHNRSRRNFDYDISTVEKYNQKIDYDFNEYQFVGVMKFSKKTVQRIKKLNKNDFQKIKLSKFIEYITNEFSLESLLIDSQGLWAELRNEKDQIEFKLRSKSQTLKFLEPKTEFSKILPQYTFNYSSWISRKLEIIADLQNKYKRKNVIIRSSNSSEDSLAISAAGKFESILDVDVSNKELLIESVEAVFQSYKISIDTNLDEEIVFIQEMKRNVKAAGVIFTREINSAAPFYVINYDIESGLTDTVTSGETNSLKCVYVAKNSNLENVNDKILKQILLGAKEIENILKYDALDIEFLIDDAGTLFTLQARPLNTVKRKSDYFDEFVYENLKIAKEDLNQNVNSLNAQIEPILGVMPDWNPAEIIGFKPKKFSFELYKDCILDTVWSEQRYQFGYRDVRRKEFLRLYNGTPYVDVNVSLESFIPASLSDKIASKLLQCASNRLVNNPSFHDKIEFECIPTCFSFSTSELIISYGPNIFSGSELREIIDAYKAITEFAFNNFMIWDQNIERLNKNYQDILMFDISPEKLVAECIRDLKVNGTLPFAHAARCAFIATNIVKDAFKYSIITESEHLNFWMNINTVSQEYLEDLSKLSSGTLNSTEFLSRYGHLRPGTYDICAQTYNELYSADPSMFKQYVHQSEKVDFNLDCYESAIKKMNNRLNAEGFTLSEAQLGKFLKYSIESREKYKFRFSKILSEVIENLKVIGKKKSLNLDQLSHLSHYDILTEEGTHLQEKSKKNKIEYELQQFHTPELIFGSDGLEQFCQIKGQPNYIGDTMTSGVIVDPVSSSNNDNRLNGNIVLIESADPGFDWIFGMGIAGLVTKFGGANSHMAIRCSELNITAAIGVGEELYHQILNSDGKITIDPKNRRLHCNK